MKRVGIKYMRQIRPPRREKTKSKQRKEAQTAPYSTIHLNFVFSRRGGRVWRCSSTACLVLLVSYVSCRLSMTRTAATSPQAKTHQPTSTRQRPQAKQAKRRRSDTNSYFFGILLGLLCVPFCDFFAHAGPAASSAGRSARAGSMRSGRLAVGAAGDERAHPDTV